MLLRLRAGDSVREIAQVQALTALRGWPDAATKRNDLLELLDDHVGTRSTLLTGRLPVNSWHGWLADAILDRIVHGSHRIVLTGAALRRKRTP